MVLSGSARFTFDGEEIEAAAGTVIFVDDPRAELVAIAEEAGRRSSRSAPPRARCSPPRTGRPIPSPLLSGNLDLCVVLGEKRLTRVEYGYDP